MLACFVSKPRMSLEQGITRAGCHCWQELPASYWDRFNTRLEQAIKLGGVRAVMAALDYFRVNSAEVPARVIGKVHMQVRGGCPPAFAR